MKALSQLTDKIRHWNFMGLSLLPTLQLAIVHSVKSTPEVIQILKAFGCHDLLYSEDIGPLDQDFKKKEQVQIDQDLKAQNESKQKQKLPSPQNNDNIEQKSSNTLESFDPRLKSTLYGIYLIHKPIECRIHIVVDLQNNGKIIDQILKKTKKIIEKLKRNKSIIFINFNSSTHKLDEMNEHIEKFGFNFRTKQREIRGDQLYFPHSKPIKKKKVNIDKSLARKKKATQKDQKSKAKKSSQQSTKSKEEKSMEQFTSLVKTKINSKFELKNIDFTQILMSQIEKKYISLFGVQINKNFLEMKTFHKQILTQIKRYSEIFEISQALSSFEKQQANDNDSQRKSTNLKDRILTKHALTSLHKSKEYLISSLIGTFTSIEMVELSTKSKKGQSSIQRRSLHWQVMEIMNEIWDIQGDTLIKQIDKMPLTYIKERYKMLDYQTIGGFMPAACFEAIFSAPLRKMVQHIMETLEIIEMKIVAQIKSVVEYFFHHTSCCYDFSDSLAEQISKINQQFRRQTQRVLKSQIQFISVSSEDFWSFKQVKSNLYGPQQQIYIEIKYIGKNYIKKVFDSIRQTLPRLIGQNLLKEIVNFLEVQSLTLLTTILNENPFTIELSNREINKIKHFKQQQRSIDRLIYYFSLKTSSEVNVKNLHQRMDKNWKRMFEKEVHTKLSQFDSEHDQKKQGFFAWAKQLFTKTKKNQRPKRSLSQQKDQNFKKQSDEVENPQSNQQRKSLALTEKNWLLIINTGKFVESQKIYLSGCEGFSLRLRPSIWLYLARKQFPQNVLPKVQYLLDEALNVTEQESLEIKDVFKQIDKDVNRTPPPSLFKKGYLGDSLTRVLRAYSIYDKDLRYTQGMNFIVAIILCVLTHYGEEREFEDGNQRKSKMYFQVLENNCFAIFVHMMYKKGLRKIMLIQRQIITDLCIKLTSYIAKNSPVMSEKIQQSGFSIEMIFSPALISALKSADVDFPLQKRVIDLVLVSDFSFLYKVIGGFVVSAQGLCQKLQGEMLYYFLHGKLYNEVYKVIGDDGLAKMFKGL